MSEGNFGLRVRQARDRAGLTSEKLAERAGITRQWLGKIENGQASPTLDTAGALLQVLSQDVKNLSTPWFLVGAGPPEVATVEASVERRDFLRMLAAAAFPTPTSSPMNIDLERCLSPTLDATTLDELEALTAQFARMRQMTKPRNWLAMVLPHLTDLQSRIDAGPSGGPLRRRLLSLTAGTAALYAWVSLMAEMRIEARMWIDHGMQLAREAGDTDVLSLLLMLRADSLSAVPTGGMEGLPALARATLEEAVSLTSPSTPIVLRAPVLLRLAEEYAYAGNEPMALAGLVQGHDVAGETLNRDHYLRPRWAHPTMFDSWRASCLQLLNRGTEAVDMLEDMLQGDWPDSHRTLLLADAAAAHARAGDVVRACELLHAAIDLVALNGYRGAGRRIVGIRVRLLAPWDGEARVAELDKRLSTIL